MCVTRNPTRPVPTMPTVLPRRSKPRNASTRNIDLFMTPYLASFLVQ